MESLMKSLKMVLKTLHNKKPAIQVGSGETHPLSLKTLSIFCILEPVRPRHGDKYRSRTHCFVVQQKTNKILLSLGLCVQYPCCIFSSWVVQRFACPQQVIIGVLLVIMYVPCARAANLAFITVGSIRHKAQGCHVIPARNVNSAHLPNYNSS